jgi:hypothetical protein
MWCLRSTEVFDLTNFSRVFGNLAPCRIVRAFLIEEQKIVKKVLAEKSKKTKKSE